MQELDKELLRNINVLAFFKKCNDEDVLVKTIQTISLFKLRDKAINRFAMVGLKAEIVNPADANCIVRTFQKYESIISTNEISYYGVICFAKKDGEWVAYFGDDNEMKIDFAKQVIRERDFKYQGQSEGETTEFFDTYLRISEK